jgi:hypothetical protein
MHLVDFSLVGDEGLGRLGLRLQRRKCWFGMHGGRCMLKRLLDMRWQLCIGLGLLTRVIIVN